MTEIPAKVVNLSKFDGQYFVAVQIGRDIYPGAFDGLSFGENKPFVGWYHYGWLDLRYQQDPDLHVGQEFRLWTLA